MKLYCFLIAFSFCSGGLQAQQDTLHYPEEIHFKNVRQLTFGGDNAEAYWSFDGNSLVFQRTAVKQGTPCDQIFAGKLPGQAEKFTYQMISTGKGRTTCAFLTKDNGHVLYASTHEKADTCPPPVDRAKYGNRYIWPVYSGYDIYMADLNGRVVKKLTSTEGYDAEATLSPDGSKMLFTSVRNGDLDLYVMDLTTGMVKQLTDVLGYDGGAWFSRDGKKIVWRASRPSTEEEIKEYKDLLKEGLVAPTRMEVFVADADGSHPKQVTYLGGANWAPNFTPDGRIIFCSNHEYKRGFPFNMYIINTDGTGLQKISRDKGFDAFPMFSPDGKKILFSSNRNNGGTRETNVFVADWVEEN
jgi:Tol biopolymer transport system component